MTLTYVPTIHSSQNTQLTRCVYKSPIYARGYPTFVFVFFFAVYFVVVFRDPCHERLLINIVFAY